MATKKVSKPTAIRTSGTAPTADSYVVGEYAPAYGVDSTFDESDEKIWESVEAAGNPEGLTRDFSRERYAYAYRKHSSSADTLPPPAGSEPVVEEPEEDQTPRETVLALPNVTEEAYWYEEPGQAKAIDWFISSRRALGRRFVGGLIITGPAGTGKTLGIKHAVERYNKVHSLSIPYLKMDCATITDSQKWLGRRELDENGTRFEKSDFLIAAETGSIILLDEINRLHPTYTNIIMAMLDGSQAIRLSDMNEVISVHPETVILATANMGAQFGGTHRFDWAMRERFPFTIERGWPPEEDEHRILTTATGIDPDAAAVLIQFAAKTRQMYANGDLRSPVSTRTLVSAAFMVASGATEREALSFTAFPLYDGNAEGLTSEKTERSQVMVALDGIIGRRR